MKRPLKPDTLSLDVGHASSAESLHEMLAAVLHFPGYFGKNWVAFWDCVRDPDQSVMPRRLRAGRQNCVENLQGDENHLRRLLVSLFVLVQCLPLPLVGVAPDQPRPFRSGATRAGGPR